MSNTKVKQNGASVNENGKFSIEPPLEFIDPKQQAAIAELEKYYPDLGEDLVVKGHLNLAERLIERLPANLAVHGDLDLRGCYMMEELPANLAVHGNLYVECDGPMKFTGPIYIKGAFVDIDTDNIPDNFSIGGDLFPAENSTKLPSNLTIGGSLVLTNTAIEELPAGLKVLGNLSIKDTKISMLPEDLYVGGYFDMGKTAITSIPKTVYLGGGIDAHHSALKVFPKNIITVNGNLDISYTKVRYINNGMVVKGHFWANNGHLVELPETMEVWGSMNIDMCESLEVFPAGVKVGMGLYLSGCPIDELPANLHVNGCLDISNTSIRRLPEGLIVNNQLSISGSQLTELPSFLNVGRISILLDRTHLKGLPDGFSVTGTLSIGRYDEKVEVSEWELPDNMKVGEHLVLYKSGIKKLPAGLVIGGDLNLVNAGIEYLPKDTRIGGILTLGHKHWDLMRGFLRGDRNIEGTVKICYRDYNTANMGVILEGDGIRDRLSRADEYGEDIVTLAPPPTTSGQAPEDQAGAAEGSEVKPSAAAYA